MSIGYVLRIPGLIADGYVSGDDERIVVFRTRRAAFVEMADSLMMRLESYVTERQPDHNALYAEADVDEDDYPPGPEEELVEVEFDEDTSLAFFECGQSLPAAWDDL